MKSFSFGTYTSSDGKNIGELILLVTCHRVVQFQRVVISQCWAQKEALIERFNLQSGLSRGAYEDPAVGYSCAHNASVNGLATDSTNTLLTSGGYDGLLKVSCLALLFVLSSGVLHPVIGLTSSQSSLS